MQPPIVFSRWQVLWKNEIILSSPFPSSCVSVIPTAVWEASTYAQKRFSQFGAIRIGALVIAVFNLLKKIFYYFHRNYAHQTLSSLGMSIVLQLLQSLG